MKPLRLPNTFNDHTKLVASTKKSPIPFLDISLHHYQLMNDHKTSLLALSIIDRQSLAFIQIRNPCAGNLILIVDSGT